jgi:hypothetical protein
LEEDTAQEGNDYEKGNAYLKLPRREVALLQYMFRLDP